MAEEWVDHALDQTWQAIGKLIAAERAHAEVDNKLKDSLAHLTEVERAKKNVELCPSQLREIGC